MDPTARINALRQYMDFYRQNAPTPYVNYHNRSQFDMTSPDSSDPRQAQAMDFAQNQVGQEAPDFFGGATPQYTPPQSVQSIAGQAGFPLAPQDRQPMMRRPDVTQSGMAANFLRNLFAGR